MSTEKAPLSVPEDVAHAVLARAIQIDSLRTAEFSLDALRDIAREIGITDQTLETAWQEVITSGREPTQDAARSGTKRGRLLDRLLGFASKPAAAHGFGNNLLSIAVTMMSTLAGAWIGGVVAPAGLGIDAGIFAGLAVGSAFVQRKRAWPANLLFTGLTIWTGVELAFQTIFGIRSIQGGETHFAVLVASCAGLILGILIRRESLHAGPEKYDAPTRLTASPGVDTADADDQPAETPLAYGRLNLVTSAT